jgi:hypothetical protein
MAVSQWWSIVLTTIGVTGFWLAGRKVWWCWYVNIACQFVWLAYALATRQWGFLLSVFVYGPIFVKNAVTWTREHREGGSMGFIKRGVGEVLPEEGEQQPQNAKTAAEANWSEQDQHELDDENTKADR